MAKENFKDLLTKKNFLGLFKFFTGLLVVLILIGWNQLDKLKAKWLKLIEKVFSWLLIKIFVCLSGWSWRRMWKIEPEYYEGLNWIIKLGRKRCIIENIENLPQQGPFIIALNHMGSWNLVLVIGAFSYILKTPIFIVVEPRVWQKDPDMAKNWLAFLERRDKSPGLSLRAMIKKIKANQITAITPCGMRDKKQRGNIDLERMFEEAKAGVGYLVDYAPVVPIGFWAPDSDRVLQGIWAVIQILSGIKKIRVKIGQSIIFDESGGVLREKKSAYIVDEIFKLVEDIKPKRQPYFI